MGAIGQTDEGLVEARRGVELDPFSHEASTYLGFSLYFARRYDEAIQQLRTAILANPDFWFTHLWLGRAYTRIGKFREAVVELQSAQRLEGSGSPEIESAIGRAYADGGERAEATKILDHLRERMRSEFVSASFLATLYVGLGEIDEAFASLAQAEVATEAKSMIADGMDAGEVFAIDVWYAYSLWMTGRLREAIEEFDRVVTATGGDPTSGARTSATAHSSMRSIAGRVRWHSLVGSTTAGRVWDARSGSRANTASASS